jgi:hypothetical protein
MAYQYLQLIGCQPASLPGVPVAPAPVIVRRTPRFYDWLGFLRPMATICDTIKYGMQHEPTALNRPVSYGTPVRGGSNQLPAADTSLMFLTPEGS